MMPSDGSMIRGLGDPAANQVKWLRAGCRVGGLL